MISAHETTGRETGQCYLHHRLSPAGRCRYVHLTFRGSRRGQMRSCTDVDVELCTVRRVLTTRFCPACVVAPADLNCKGIELIVETLFPFSLSACLAFNLRRESDKSSEELLARARNGVYRTWQARSWRTLRTGKRYVVVSQTSRSPARTMHSRLLNIWIIPPKMRLVGIKLYYRRKKEGKSRSA